MAKKKSVEDRNKVLALEGKRLKLYGMKLRMYPSQKQVNQLNQTIGSARFTYNYYLNKKQETYKETGEAIRYADFKKLFLPLKKQVNYDWLKTPDKFALENAMMDVDRAYTSFFEKRAKFPQFKKKHSTKQSYKTNMTNKNIKLNLLEQTVQLPKTGQVPIRMDKKQRKNLMISGLKGSIISATVSRHGSGKWYVSLAFEEIVVLKKPLTIDEISSSDIIGCDLGLSHFLITSKGEKINTPRHYTNALDKLVKLQRRLSKMNRGSNNYAKQKQKIAKLHLRITHMRHDFLHKTSRKLVNENQVIVLEDLNVKGMIKNRRLAKSIQDVGWGYFKTYVQYKAYWENKTVVFVNRFFPSSKLCNGCKEKNTLLSLTDRVWVCPKCAAEHDRDENAAQNIKEEGIRLLLKV